MPKDKGNRTQSRRAASKEALKQMHILLDDENNFPISSGDDDVIEVEVQPPKKKYKLSHRKSSDGNDRDVIVLKTVTSDPTPFELEVVIEDLSPAQKSRIEQAQKESRELDAKIEQLATAANTEVIYKGVCATALELTEQVQAALNPPQPAPSQSQTVVLPPPSNNGVPQSYQLVMDPRLGVIVGTVSPAGTATTGQPMLLQSKVASPTTEQPMKTRRGTMLRQISQTTIQPLQKQTYVAKSTASPKQPPAPQGKVQVNPLLGKAMGAPKQNVTTPKTLNAQQKPLLTMKRITKPSTPAPPAATPAPAPTPASVFRPTETSVEGGLSLGKTPAKSIDLTSDDGRALPDSREVSFNKLQGRTYPSLVVVARPHLRVKDLTAERGKLDVKVKSVLMYPPTKFTEWLIQQGLVRSEQKCTVHPSNALKLGMYSDASKFPYSGGYVWISECCPQRFVSVFSGSLFEGSQHPPMSILKLLYHWCCQTIVQNVTQWVKVDNLYVKGMYTWLRAVCTVALHTHVKQLGGPGVKVQVGVISLGTTSQDGNKREVKVEVLGILETTTRHIRLRAVEPLTDHERNYKKRFTKILEPVFKWVHPSSIIVTDLTVDKATLHQMGFMHVSQSTSTDYSQSNRTIMEYLRRIVPRMFQNTLSLLSRQIIQQFLDELVWREWYGTTVLQCFDNMVLHISEQTRYDGDHISMISRLNKVITNPFKNWSITVDTNAPTTAPTLSRVVEQPAPKRYQRHRKPITPQPPPSITPEPPRPAKSTSPDVPEQMVPLENYYYGTINLAQGVKNKVTINIKCPFCKLTFNTNITLMNHLFKHAHNVSNDVQLCRYCLTIVPTGNDLLKHIDTSHPGETKFDNGFVCLICESHFRNPFILGKHMSKEHCPSELPYMCGTCHYRCSNHKQAVDHFYHQHDHGTTIQCPFCLKSTTIFSGGRNITQNMNYFIQHLQKHQKKHLAKRCGRCTLWFIQKEFLKDHQNKMHASQRGKPGLVPSFAPRNGVMVPKSRMDKCPDDGKVINFSALFFNVGKTLNCKECAKPLSEPKHFTSFESCQNSNCQYATCCSYAIQDHAVKCKWPNAKLPEEKLPYEMFCICGFSATSGNGMAKHLAICERKSAYPSADAAKQATVTHSMLDVLGLVRKADEASSKSEPPLILKRSEPLILKQRGRPRKHPLPTLGKPVIVKEVIEVKDDEPKSSEESSKINIIQVRGGVEDDELREQEKTSKKEEEVKEEISSDTLENKNSENVKGGKEEITSDSVERMKDGEEDDDVVMIEPEIPSSKQPQENPVSVAEEKSDSAVVSEDNHAISVAESETDEVVAERSENKSGEQEITEISPVVPHDVDLETSQPGKEDQTEEGLTEKEAEKNQQPSEDDGTQSDGPADQVVTDLASREKSVANKELTVSLDSEEETQTEDLVSEEDKQSENVVLLDEEKHGEDVVPGEPKQNDNVVLLEEEKHEEDVVPREEKQSEYVVLEEEKHGEDVISEEEKQSDDVVSEEEKQSDDVLLKDEKHGEDAVPEQEKQDDDIIPIEETQITGHVSEKENQSENLVSEDEKQREDVVLEEKGQSEGVANGEEEQSEDVPGEEDKGEDVVSQEEEKPEDVVSDSEEEKQSEGISENQQNVSEQNNEAVIKEGTETDLLSELQRQETDDFLNRELHDASSRLSNQQQGSVAVSERTDLAEQLADLADLMEVDSINKDGSVAIENNVDDINNIDSICPMDTE